MTPRGAIPAVSMDYGIAEKEEDEQSVPESRVHWMDFDYTAS